MKSSGVGRFTVSHAVAKLSATGGRSTVRSLVVLLAATLTGCALAPGMRMDERAAVERGRQRDGAFRVQPITARLIAAQAQAAAEVASRAPDPLGSEPAGPYTVAPHDVLHVTVWAHPELTVPAGAFRSPEENGIPVLEDGTIYYPYVGIVHVAGKTLREVRALLAVRLEGVIPNPQLDVRVAAYRGRKVQVTGDVVAPTTMPITDVPVRVQDAIAFARGVGPEADLSAVTLVREGRVHRLDLLAFYERGDTTQNWLLRDGDVLNVPNRNRNRVFVMGEVRRPQARLMVHRRMTLAEAIGDADGLEPEAANVSRIYVIRGDFDAPEIYRLDASSADALLLATQFELRPRDVVFVSTYELTRWNRVMNQIVPTVQTLFNAAVTVDIATRPR